MVDQPRTDLPTEARCSTGRPADGTAPDGSLVRLGVSLRSASLAQFELRPGRVSIAQTHRSVDELWYVLGGTGRVWRRSTTGDETEIAVSPGVCLTIPVGTTFQFRCDGTESLTIVGTTVPPWPGDDEAVAGPGRWEPSL